MRARDRFPVLACLAISIFVLSGYFLQFHKLRSTDVIDNRNSLSEVTGLIAQGPTSCDPDRPFVLGNGEEYVEHGSEGDMWPFQIFKSSSSRPPVVAIKQSPNAELAPGFLFIALREHEVNTIKMPGPMIFTDQGRLVWSGPVGNATSFRWQKYHGKPTLLFWMEFGPESKSSGYGNITLLNQDYSVKTVLCPRHGLYAANLTEPRCEADLHEAHIVPSRNTIITTAYNATSADLSSINGPANGWLWDCHFYELDITSGEVLFQWRASDHIPFTESRKALGIHGSLDLPYDPYHLNSVVDVGDHYLVSIRHLWTIYLIDKQGNIVWRFAGDGTGDFGALSRRARFRWQHDARPHNIGPDHLDISLLDNENRQTRAKEQMKPAKLLVFRLPMNPIRESNASQAQVLQVIQPQAAYEPISQGGFDNNLPHGNKLANWGDIPILSEFDRSGREIWTAEFGRTGGTNIYRGFKQEWHATPYTQPDLVVERNSADQSYHGYVSWNGATDVEGWNVYAGLGADGMEHLGVVEKKGFETKFELPCWTRFAQVGAIERGQEVRRSRMFRVH